MARPRKLGRGNTFKRVDEWREEQRAQKIRETVERKRRVPPPDEVPDDRTEGEQPRTPEPPAP